MEVIADVSAGRVRDAGMGIHDWCGISMYVKIDEFMNLETELELHLAKASIYQLFHSLE